MLIDRRHTAWGVATGALLGGATWAWLASHSAPGGARPGSTTGLALGAAALATMLFAGVLGARKRLVRWYGISGVGFVPRLGSLEWWTKGHIWLGAASLPLVLLHASFRTGGSVTLALVWLTVAVVGTGILGLVLQHLLPHALTSLEQGQTTYEVLERRRENLVQEAHAIVKKASDDALKAAREAHVAWRSGAKARTEALAGLSESDRPKRLYDDAERESAYARAVAEAQAVSDRLGIARDRLEAARPAQKKEKVPLQRVPASAKRSRASMGTYLVEVPKGPLKAPPEPATLVAPAELVAFYDEVALPFLMAPGKSPSPLEDDLGSQIVFDSVRHRIPEAYRAALAELRARCDGVRRKAGQRSLFRILHGWLLVHVPLAVILLVLAVAHAVMALRY